MGKHLFYIHSYCLRAVLSLALLTCTVALSATVRYVKPTATGTGDGSSWANASGDLQAMINASAANDQVWVAAGTYKPTTCTTCTDSDRSISFVMKNNLAIYGGFNGSETALSQRNWTNNVTILSGNIGDANSNGDNSFHVISNSNNSLGPSAVIDGFTISGGNANGSSNGSSQNYSAGGGMFNYNSSPTVTNCRFSGNSANSGGGMFNFQSTLSVTSCSFSGNSASYGGGMYNLDCSPSVHNCNFSGNSATQGGGMINPSSSSPVVTNCSFSGNSASEGGGMWIGFGSSPALTNCSFSGNSANGGGIYVRTNSNPSLTNCILWGDNNEIVVNNYVGSSTVSLNNSILQGSCPGFVTCTNVLNVDPLFVSQPPVGLGTSGDLHLQACSPAIDAGTASGAPGTDKDGLGRVDAINSGGLVDIGAYEYQSDLDADNDGYAYCGGTDCNDNPANGGTAINPATVWYQDADNDGYSNGSTLMQCAQPSGYKLATNLTATSGDCNDGNAAINPAATEVCDGIDNNCNNSTDEGNVCCPAGGILYVNASATGLNNGRSWTDAYTSLQSAIASTCPGISQIWVAAGTYKPTTGADRSISFVMKNNLAIYGGFNGSETSLTERNWTGNVTILSGNIGDDNSNSDNSYHVISNFNNGLNSSAILDGFTISGGNANGSSQNSLGGGMSNFNSSPGVRNCSFSGNSAYYGGGMGNMQSSSPSVTNCSFTGNSAGSGGGMQNEYNSSPIISNCIFGNNTATSYGGGMYNNSSSPSLSNCSLSDNTASSGGGMYNNNSSPSLSNCSFPDNTATNNGGGMLNSSSSPSLNNCSFSNNTATNNGGGINNYFSSSPAVTNCSFSGNSAGYYGGGMYNTSASSPIVNNSNFSDNSAQYGGGMYNIGTSPNVTNCSFSGNSASIDGGGMLNLSFSSPNLTNCSFTGNHANGDGGGMDNENSSPTLTTCIFPAIRQVKAAVCTTGTPSRT